MKPDLKGRSVRGGAVMMAAQGARIILQMGSTVVLSRGAELEYRIIAINKAGEGDPSNMVMVVL